MSILRPFLNKYLRLIERRRMTKGSPDQLRASFERTARLMFRPPRGTQKQWIELCAGQRRIRALDVVPRRLSSKTVLFGGFVFGNPRTHAAMLGALGKRLGARAVLPEYRLAPEAPFPAAVEDVRLAWEGLLASGVQARDVVLGGDSAGGALALGLISALSAEGADMPAAAFCFSPLTDLTCSGESFASNAQRDVFLPAERAPELMELYLAGHPAGDPRVSPLFAPFHGAPPLWVTVGDTEILLDDARRIVARVKEHGGQATLAEVHDLPHVWPIFHSYLPEARQTLDALAGWIRQQQEPKGES